MECNKHIIEFPLDGMPFFRGHDIPHSLSQLCIEISYVIGLYLKLLGAQDMQLLKVKLPC